MQEREKADVSGSLETNQDTKLPVTTQELLLSTLFRRIFIWECNLPMIRVSTAQFRRRTFHEPNLIPWIKYMKSSASESVKNGYLNLERLSRSSRLAQPGISPLERLWFRRRNFHVPNLMHKLL